MPTYLSRGEVTKYGGVLLRRYLPNIPSIFQVLDRRYKKNLKSFFIVHPTNFIRVVYNFFKPIIRLVPS